MATESTPIASQPMQKVSDVITRYRPCKILPLASQGDTEPYITSLDFDDTGEFLVAACDDETIQLYNAKEGKHQKPLYSKKYGVHLAKFTHQSQSVLYASTKVDDALRLLSLHDSTYQRYFVGHSDKVTSITLSPANDHFLSCSIDNTVRLWDLNSRNAQGKLNLTTPYLATYDPSATVIAVASPSTSSILLYDARNYDKAPFETFDLQEHEQLYTPNTVARDWTKLEFSNDGRHLVLGTEHAGHFVLDAFDGRLRAFLRRPYGSTGRRAPGSRTGLPLGQGDTCLTPDGRYVLGFSGKKSDMAVWDLSEGSKDNEPARILEPTMLQFRKSTPIVQYNPKYNMIATADKEVMFWLPGDLNGES